MMLTQGLCLLLHLAEAKLPRLPTLSLKYAVMECCKQFREIKEFRKRGIAVASSRNAGPS
jgi:hypothetical protein